MPVAGPPFPAPPSGVMLVDHAGVFSNATEEFATQRIAEIARRHAASVVVYTQYKPGSDERSTERDAIALKLGWQVTDGVVVMWNTTSPECIAGEGDNGQVQLYADSRFSATRLSELKRQKIYDDLMLPLLVECNEDNALLAALDGIDAEMRTAPPPPSNDASSKPPTSSQGACGDDAYKLSGFQWDQTFEWFFQEASVPDGYDSGAVLQVLIRSAENVTTGSNDCGLPDRIDATATYAGTTTREPCTADEADGFNSVGFGVLPDRQADDTLAYVCTYGSRRSVVEADMLINSEIAWALSEDECSGFEELLEATITHEFGHVFGLGHVAEREHGDLTMSPTSNGPCDAEEITLGWGDVLGLEELY